MDLDHDGEKTNQKMDIPTIAILSEGKKYLRLSRLDKAISSFNKILDKNPNHVPSLLYRAKCYARLAKYRNAWLDSDRAIHLNPKCTEAVYLKAVNEYLKGDFEKSFITCWQGHLKEPKDVSLKKGFQFCKTAIENSLYANKGTLLTDKDIFRMNWLHRKSSSLAANTSLTKNMDFTKKGLFSADLKLLADMLSGKNSAPLHTTCKDLYEFLTVKKMLREIESNIATDKSNCKTFIKNNIHNLSKMNYLIRKFELCRIALEEGDTVVCLKKGNELLNSLINVFPDFPNETEIQIETLHSLVTACLMEKDVTRAKNYCELQLNSINESNLQRFKGRALRDFGEVYCKSAEYGKAVQYFEESLEFSECEREKAILLYKVSDCNMRVNNLKDAQDTAQRCLDLVTRHHDKRFRIDVLLLLAEIAVKGRDMEEGKIFYKQALEVAIESNDDRSCDLEHLHLVSEEMASKGCYSKERLKIVELTNTIKHT